MKVVGRRCDTEQVVELTVADHRVVETQVINTAEHFPWIAPAMVDLQVNGFAQVELNDPALVADDVRTVSLAMDSMGVGKYLPTITTESFELMHHAVATVAQACRDFPEVDSRVAGIHLEGPSISPEDGPRGAHPRVHCREPSVQEFDKLQTAAEGRIRIVTLAPEYESAPDFIRHLAAQNVIAAIGHTAADSAQIAAAVDAGASMSTHLGNGAHGTIRRHPNYLWDQLAEDRLTASLIADGHHLPPAVLKTFWRAKGATRCVLVSDLTSMAGMPAGRYQTSGLGEVEVLEDGRLVVAGQRQYLAGAAAAIGVGVANMIRFTEASLNDAIEMASTLPAKLIGTTTGGFEIGDPASWVLFDWKPSDADLTIKELIRGE